MNEVKTPKKPLIVYYAIAILVVLLINTLLVPMVSQARVKYVDYGTFIQMTKPIRTLFITARARWMTRS